MITTSNLEEAKKAIGKEMPLKVILAHEDVFNRKILEYGKFDILLSVEDGIRKDKIRQTDSGFNHVLAVIAEKNKIAMGIDLQKIKKLDLKEKANRLSKIMQNIRICRKAGTRIAVGTHSMDLARDFLIGLGASTNQIKETIVF